MALAPCRECGHQVSTEALACPKCGAKDPTGAEKEREREQTRGLMMGCGIPILLLLGLMTYCAVSSSRDVDRETLARIDAGLASPGPGSVARAQFDAVSEALASSPDVTVEAYDPGAPNTMRITVLRSDVSGHDARKIASMARERLGEKAIVYVNDDTGRTLAKAAPWGIE